MGAFLSPMAAWILKQTAIFCDVLATVRRHCGASGVFPHHPLTLEWFYCPALLLSAVLGCLLLHWKCPKSSWSYSMKISWIVSYWLFHQVLLLPNFDSPP